MRAEITARFPAMPTGTRVGHQGGLSVVVHALATTGRPLPCLLWMHGAGYLLGGAVMDDAVLSGWAAGLGYLVVSIDYRLAPEHSYPAACLPGDPARL